MKDLLHRNIDAIGIDPLITNKQHEHFPFLIRADARKLPFPENRFDQIFATFTFFLEMYEGNNEIFLEKTLQEFSRVLRPSGTVVIGGTWNPLAIRIAEKLGFTLIKKGSKPDRYFILQLITKSMPD